MDDLRQTTMRVIAAALISALVLPMVRDSAAGKILRMVCAIYITVSLISPVRGMDFQAAVSSFYDISRQAQLQTDFGVNRARLLQEEIINQRCQAYILDKASELGASVTVEFLLSEEDIPVPIGVYIRGTVSEETKKCLGQILTEDMGIAKEDQIWIG